MHSQRHRGGKYFIRREDQMRKAKEGKGVSRENVRPLGDVANLSNISAAPSFDIL